MIIIDLTQVTLHSFVQQIQIKRGGARIISFGTWNPSIHLIRCRSLVLQIAAATFVDSLICPTADDKNRACSTFQGVIDDQILAKMLKRRWGLL